tara:strand:+ start:19719 stop:20888 length:1170 start_codon:yes stop_codon:yes gene_type:complete
MNRRLAIVVSHPTQYYSPWFRFIAETTSIELRVFYLWNFGIGITTDPKFERQIKWDIPLLDGYDSTFVENRASDPGTHHFRGLDNPSLSNEVTDYAPQSILVFGYAWKSMLSLIWRRPKRMPVLLRGDSHGLVASRPTIRQISRRLVTRATLSRCQAMLAVGAANAAFYESNGVDPKKIFHVPHCVDNSRFQASKNRTEESANRLKIGTLREKVVFLFAGKFESKKRPDLLVQAFRHIQFSSAELWMIGSGPLESELRHIAGGDSRIQFFGFRNQAELPAIFSAGDAIVLPSEGPGETWGLVVNEAMNCDCAPIVSDHVGCHPDLVHANKNGWIFEAGSLSGLVSCLNDAVIDSQRLKRFKLNSRRLIEEYSYTKATQGLMQAIEAVTS